MALISVYKVVSSLPSSLNSNALYLVRTGTGFDFYVSDSTGSIAYQINSSATKLSNIVEDTTPQLGGDLDLNGNDITGTGNISITGEIEADIHIGSLRGEIQFKAKAGEALTKGDPVYISSYDTVGNTPIVAIADANDSARMPCFGLANESVSLNASVNVVTFGTLSGLDTSGFSLGDTLYISNTGTLTNSKPTGESSLIQNIGKVQRVDNAAGSIKVGGAGRTNDVPNLNQGNVFIGNASNQAEARGLTLDDIAETATNKHFTSGDESKLGHISVTQAVDLDTMESNIAANNAKVTNATHTGDVTGATALTIANNSVTNAKMANVATGTVKGRTAAGAGNIEDLDIDTTLKMALNLSKTDVGLGNVPNTDCTDASNISTGTLSINQLPSGINADQVDGLDASQFLRSDAGDTINVGRGDVYIENNSDDNQNGAGITIRTSSNPNDGSEGSVGSIFAIRSSGGLSRLWVGQTETTTGYNNFVTNNAEINGNISVTGTVDGRDVLADGTKLDGIESGAEVNVNADWNAVSGDAQILNKPTTITSAEQTKLGHISVTQPVNLDSMESNIATNNAKISNATHTGDVTGATALTIANNSVTNAKMANVATGTVKGRTAAGAGNIEDLDIDTTLKMALNLSKTDVGLGNVPNTDCTDASNISTGTLSINQLPSGINADQVDGLDASQFLRSDAGDTINVGRGDVYIENNSDDNQNGAGITIRTSSNPNDGSEGSVGSIFAIRSSGGLSRLWVGQTETTTGYNNFVTNNAEINGNISVTGTVDGRDVSADGVKLDGIENNATTDQTKADIDALNINADQVDGLEASQFLRSDTGDTINGNLTIAANYYMSNNSNIFHAYNSNTQTPSTTATEYYAVFGTTTVTNTDIYSHGNASSSANTGIRLLKAGKYKVSYTFNWENANYNNRINFMTNIMKHSSAITPNITEINGTRSFAYARDDNFAKFATTMCVTVIDVEANEYIKFQTKVAKNDANFNDAFNGIRYHQNSSVVVEYLGNI